MLFEKKLEAYISLKLNDVVNTIDGRLKVKTHLSNFCEQLNTISYYLIVCDETNNSPQEHIKSLIFVDILYIKNLQQFKLRVVIRNKRLSLNKKLKKIKNVTTLSPYSIAK